MNKLKEQFALLRFGIKEIHRLLPHHLLVILAGGLVYGLQPLIPVYFSAKIIEELLGNKDLKTLALYVGLLVTLFALLTVLNKWLSQKWKSSVFLFTTLQGREQNQALNAVDYEQLDSPDFQKLLRNHRAILENYGGSLTQMSFALWRMSTGFFSLLFSLILAGPVLLKCVTATGDHFFESPQYGLLTLGIILLCVLLLAWEGKKNNDANRPLRDKEMQNFAFFKYFFELPAKYKYGKEIRIFNQQKLLKKMNDKYLTQTQLYSIKILSRSNRRMESSTMLLQACMFGAIYLYVALKALFGVLEVDSLVMFIGSLQQVATGATALIGSISMLAYNVSNLSTYQELKRIESLKYQGSLPVEKRSDYEYELEFRNVSFRYPGVESYALKNFSFKLKIGQHLAVVGKNGSGKTTFIKLLCRLYEPTEGEILLNGINIQKYDYQEYLTIFSVVFQDFAIFSLPIGQNVAASVDYDKEKAWNSLEKAGLAERVQQLPNGLDTYLYKDFEESGIEISGGEAQKLALARALYKDAPFIILDEPTAALDPVAEYEIYQKFNQFVGGKTAVYISHRLSSCQFCDQIAVFDQGRLVQTGSHPQLLAQTAGQYHALWQAQSHYYTEKEAKQLLG